MPPFYFNTDFRYKRQPEKDPLRRFEYLKNAKPSSVMIRATPNSVRWDEINRVQYRFQALNFHSDVLEALIHNSPPLSRRERALTIPVKKSTQTNSCSSESSEHSETERRDTISHPQVRCIRRSASFDAANCPKDEYLAKRKGSVVQIMKDDTSDYNSDEEVFSKSEIGSMEKINYNATLVHVENRHITDTTQIQVTNCISDNNNGPYENRLIDTIEEVTSLPYEDNNNNNNVENVTSAVRIPVFSHDDSISSGYESSTTSYNNKNDNDVDEDDEQYQKSTTSYDNTKDNEVDEDDELHQKSKGELVELIRRLQDELKQSKEGTTSPLIQRKKKPTLELKPSWNPLASTNTGQQDEYHSVSTLVNNLESLSNSNHRLLKSPRIRELSSPLKSVRSLSAAFKRENEKTQSLPSSPTRTHSRTKFGSFNESG